MKIDLDYGELYEIKACVNMTHNQLSKGEYKAYLESLENKLNTLLEQGKGTK